MSLRRACDRTNGIPPDVQLQQTLPRCHIPTPEDRVGIEPAGREQRSTVGGEREGRTGASQARWWLPEPPHRKHDEAYESRVDDEHPLPPPPEKGKHSDDESD